MPLFCVLELNSCPAGTTLTRFSNNNSNRNRDFSSWRRHRRLSSYSDTVIYEQAFVTHGTLVFK
ncbi:hypothetical protein TcasGA2_TC031433 [Tribolium castaneum]|uniref:Uncharacterized protein n=1 Tax=Tribolium castaneum TaxID=7070 RepID=A0A139WAJ7_TRICA|nr:hypothetical protein TcasGA2_TC031433 [Tribolium castaneum]